MSASPVITPPRDKALRERLQKKLEEYRHRKAGKGEPWEFQHPQLAHKENPNYRDACYKTYILEKVLSSPVPVSTYELSFEMAKRYGEDFNIPQFNNAAGVISAYCGDLDEETSGGTGLPAA